MDSLNVGNFHMTVYTVYAHSLQYIPTGNRMVKLVLQKEKC